MPEYEAVIGMEVHAQLLTKSKLFCGCSTDFGAEPNTQVCPVCLGFPGTLPVLNAQAVDFVVRTGLAMHCTIDEESIFARKNYYYPDLPKAYQISQYETPLCREGWLEIEVGGKTKRIRITRIHLEEDTGKTYHTGGDASLVDYNRCGVPLMEIVSEPDLRSAEEARAYLVKLRQIVRYLGVCDGNMEEGSFRCDANVSIRPFGQEELGIRAELKNMNSFRNVQRAIDYEVERQRDILEQGGKVVQETRLWDADKSISRSMRGKEEAHDYRYFPDPDLLPVLIDEPWIDAVRETLPELPQAKRSRFMAEYGVPPSDADVLTGSRQLADYFEATVAKVANAKMVSNWMLTELLRHLNDDKRSIETCPVSPDGLASLLKLIEAGTISGTIAKKVFSTMYAGKNNDAAGIVKNQGLVQIDDRQALQDIIQQILAAHPEEVEKFKQGKTKVFGFLVGQVMRQTRGKANPGLVNEMLRQQLAAGGDRQ